MAIELKQQLRLSQQLVMTPQLQQAIRLLQLSRLELTEVVREELMENPVLEDGLDTDGEPPNAERAAADSAEAQLGGESEPAAPEVRDATSEVAGDSAAAVAEIDWEGYLDSYTMSPVASAPRDSGNEDLPSLEATLTRQTSLFDHLLGQLKLGKLTAEDEAIGVAILGNLDDNGYLCGITPAEIAFDQGADEAHVERVLGRIQDLDPGGVGARDLRECLVIQARQRGQDDPILLAILERHLGNLEKKNYAAIAKDLDQPLDEIIEAIKVIASLDPKPGREYAADENRTITPDVYVHKVGDKYFVVPNDDGLPKLKISSFYRSALSGGPAARQYVQDKLRSAQWLIRSIQQRQRTIVRVTESIVKFQRGFLDRGIAHLRPLILRDVAEDIGMHESTISRVTTSKYVHTPQGMFELKFFFSTGISRSNGEDDLASAAVKDAIRGVCGREDPRQPLSDQKIVELLEGQNIRIARRTVAKYREQLGILSSGRRRQVL